MATFYQTDIVTRRQPARIDAGPCNVSQRAVYVVKALPVINDIIEMLVLPADHVLVSAQVDTDVLDAGTALVWSAGIMSGTVGLRDLNRTVNANLFSASTVGRGTAGTPLATAMSTLRALVGQLPANRDRSIGAKITTAPGTPITLDTTGVINKGFWQASTAYALTEYITLPDGRRARCSTAGTSGSTMPIELFSAAVCGNTVSDGTVTWTIQDPYFALTVTYRSAVGGV